MIQEELDKLYRRLFETIPAYIDILLKSSIATAFAANKIEDMQKAVAKAMEGVRMVAEGCINAHIVKTHHFAKQTHLNMCESHEVTMEIRRQVREMTDFCNEWRRRTQEDAFQCRDWLAQFLLEHLKVARLNLPVEVSIRHSRSSSPQPASPEDMMRLIQVLQVPASQAIQDLENVLRQRHVFDFASQAQVQYLWKTDQFKNWFFCSASATLLVDANFDATLAGRISPMSLFCAMMAVQLPDPDHNIWLQFFCGQYTRRSEPLYGPHGMLRSVLTQLLLQLYQRNVMALAFPEPEAAAPEGGGLPTLDGPCRMLADLLRGLPDGITVFCAIDGLSYFETDELARELCGVVDFLRDLASDNFLRCHFKLLMASATKSRFVHQRVDPYVQRVTLRRGQGTQGMTPRGFLGEAHRAVRRW